MGYKTHPIFDKIRRDTEIWRYIDLTKLLWILQEEKLHFHLLAEFEEDNFEGTLPRATRDAARVSLEESDNIADNKILGLLNHSQDAARNLSQVNCWHAKDGESAAMWKLYSSSGRGVAIKSTVGNLMDSLSESKTDVYISPVRYVDFYKKWDELSDSDREILNELFMKSEGRNLLQNAVLKRKEFSHENEIRAITTDFDNITDTGNGSGSFQNLSINPKELIDAIVLSPNMPHWAKITIENTIQDLDSGPDIDSIQESRMATENPGFN